MKLLFGKLIFAALLLAAPGAARAWEPSLMIGAGNADSQTYDFRLTQTFDPLAAGYYYELTPFVNTGLTWWRHGSRDEDVYGAVGALGLNLAFFLGAFEPYAALSAGPSLISEDHFVDRELGGGHFIFNVRAAFGLKFGESRRHNLALNLLHYSNAYTQSHNEGYNSTAVSYGYSF